MFVKKIILRFVIILLISFMTIPVFAKELVTLENIVGKTDNEEVVLNTLDKIDVNFNDLGQQVTYKIKLKNNTDAVLYVNDLIAEGLSEDFIEFSLSEKSYNMKLAPGKTNEVEVTAKTLDITHAGRNVNDEITSFKFNNGNPEKAATVITFKDGKEVEAK